jgi:citrate lyase subunit beta/citryl-CoA lyase
MRSKLFVPGSRPELFEKALSSLADGVSFDLEDAVASPMKEAARKTLAQWLQSPAVVDSPKMIIVRVNAMDTPYFKADIAQVVQPGLNMLNLPKPESPQAVLEAVHAIEQAERANGVNQDGNHPVRILLNIETPKALRIAYELASAHPRVAGLQLGLADLFEPIGISRQEHFAIKYAMMQVKLAAAQAQVAAFDGAFADIKNIVAFQEEAQFAASIGYTGKSCIHPSQIVAANEAFRPGDAAIAHALKVVAAARDADAQGLGAFVVDGQMIDPPFVRSAQALVQAARRLGLIQPTDSESE